MKDIYEIKTSQQAPHKDLASVVQKHLATQFQKPINELQQSIFQQANNLVLNESLSMGSLDTASLRAQSRKLKNLDCACFASLCQGYTHSEEHDKEGKYKASQAKKIILDSCCGTAMSTKELSEQYPEHLIIGVDKSLERINKARAKQLNDNCWQVADNAFVFRADLLDFWRLAAEANWLIEKHYLLYPNPYPKASDLTRRWQGHAIFPCLIGLSDCIEVRSNWRIYLEEFALAAKTAADFFGQTNMMTCFAEPMTAFEKKYWNTGEKTYQLILRR